MNRLKARIQQARSRAAFAVNSELVRLYHHIGSEILARQAEARWGAKVLEKLSADLREEFPEMRGLSVRNLKYMRTFARLCPGERIGQQAAAQLPWFHVVVLLTKVEAPAIREWYAARAVAEGWSRPQLEAHIKAQLHRRQGVAATNFRERLPEADATLALQYALSGTTRPMGVSEFQLVRALPEPLDTTLPTIDELEAELNDGSGGEGGPRSEVSGAR